MQDMVKHAGCKCRQEAVADRRRSWCKLNYHVVPEIMLCVLQKENIFMRKQGRLRMERREQ